MFEKYEELGSIVKFFYENHDRKNDLELYFEEVPVDFKEPSIYFPAPSIFSNFFTTHSFLNTYAWYIKIFDNSSYKAQESAMKIVNKVADNRYHIPIYNYENQATERYVKIDYIEQKKVDIGTIQIEIRFNLAYFFNREDYIKFTQFDINETVKKQE